MHDESELKISKTPGGSGSDAFTAAFRLSTQGASLNVSARGTSRDEARRNLARLLHDVAGEIQTTIGEL